MIFKKWFDAHKPIKAEAGDRWVDVLVPVIQENGTIELEVKGRHCLYDEIQSHKDSVDIQRILQRYANGDAAALSARIPMYLDTEGMPHTYAEMLNNVLAGEKFFSELPREIKERFDNNFYKFCSSIGSEEFRAAFGVVEKTAASSDVFIPEVDKGDEVNE